MALTTNLVSYYKLDETSGSVLDAQGTNNATNVGATPNETGKINTAYDFDGNEYIDLNFKPDTTTDFTWSTWVYMESQSTSYLNSILWASDSTNGQGAAFVVNGQSTGIIGAGSDRYFGMTNSNNVLNVKSSNIVPLNTWTYLSITFDESESTMKLYYNGVLDSTHTGITTPTVLSGNDAFLGVDGRNPTTNRNYDWDGKMDEVGIWDRVLTSTEIAELYNSGDGFAYPFSEPEPPVPPVIPSCIFTAGQMALSKSVALNDGTITKATLTSTEESGSFDYAMKATSDSVTPVNQWKFNNDLTDSIGTNNGTLHVKASAYYPFNGNADDESDNSNDGVLSTATVIDALDSISGIGTQRCSVTLNTTTFQEGTGAINFIKTDITDNDSYFYPNFTPQDLSNKVINHYVYIKDQATLDKIEKLQLYVFDSLTGFTWFVYTNTLNADLEIGWNVITNDLDNPVGTSGIPNLVNAGAIRIDVDTYNNSDTIAEGDLIFDYINYGTPMKTKDRFGVDNKAYNFDGNANNILVNEDGSLNFDREDNYTVSFWVKYSDSATDASVSEHWNGGGSYPWAIRSGGSMRFNIYDGSSGNPGTNAGDLSDNIWHQVTFTKEASSSTSGTLKAYADGVYVNSRSYTSLTATTKSHDDAFYIGSRGATNYMFKGELDEFLVLDKALNDNEVASLYESSSRHDLNEIYVDGKINEGADFFNSIVYSDTESDITMDHEDSSISFWVNITDEIKEQGTSIMSVSSSGGGVEHIYVCSATGGGDNIFFMEPTTNNVQITWNGKSTLTNGWHHFAFTMDTGGVPKLYLDGVDQGNPDSSQQTVVDDFDLRYITASNGYDDNYADSVSTQLDDLRIYDKTLTQADIDTIYNSGAGTEFSDTYFEPVTSGVEHTFTNSGTDLRWKATENAGSTGEINNIKIEYK